MSCLVLTHLRHRRCCRKVVRDTVSRGLDMRLGVIFLTSVTLVLIPGLAFGQAGSTGGSLGKPEKSISGERQGQSPPTSKPHANSEKSAEGATKTFLNPTINGIRVDRCWHFATECDEPAATAWCRSKGLSHAINWKWEYTDTIGQSDGRRCPVPGACGGFSIIVCK